MVTLTVNRRLARVRKQAHDAEQQHRGMRAWPSLAVYPWETWMRVLWDISLRDAYGPCLSPMQERFVWEDVIAEDASGGEDAQAHADWADHAQRAWAQLCAWGEAQEDAFAQLPAARGTPLERWGRRFRARLHEREWIDSASLADRLTRWLGKASTEEHRMSLELPQSIRLAGFDRFPMHLRRFMKCLRSCGVDVRREPFARSPGQLLRASAEDAETELLSAARWARAALETNAAHENGPGVLRIGIVVPDLERRFQDVERVFSQTLCAEQSLGSSAQTRVFALSYGPPLAQWPLIRAALQLLQGDQKPQALAAWISCLRSPFLPGAESERMVRGTLITNLQRLGEERISAERLLSFASSSSEPALRQALARCPQWTKALQNWLHTLRNEPSRQGFAAWADDFARELGAWGWSQGRALDSVEMQQRRRWDQQLNALAQLELVGGKVSRDQARAWLVRSAEDVYRPRGEQAPVQVLGVLEAHGLEFDRLWVLGLHDEAWPQSPVPHPLLPRETPWASKLPRSRATYELVRARRITQRLACSAAQVVFSAPERSGTRTLRPSALIHHLPLADPTQLLLAEDLRPALRIMQAQQTDSQKLLYIDEHSPALGPLTGPVRGGTMIFVDQSACPFRAFARHRLHARTQEPPQPGLNPLLRGNIIHRVLCEILQPGMDRTAIRAILEDRDCAQRLDETLERVMRREDDMTPHVAQVYLRLERERLIHLMQLWLEKETETRTDFQIQHVEKEYVASLGGLQVKCRVDRIDRLATGGFVLLDYKSGRSDLSTRLWSGERPREPQLPLYALTLPARLRGDLASTTEGTSVVEETSGEAGPHEIGTHAESQSVLKWLRGVAYAQVSSKQQEFQARTQEGMFPPKSSKYEALSEKHIAEWSASLRGLAQDFVEGKAAVDPRSEQECKNCGLQMLCRVHEYQWPRAADTTAADTTAEDPTRETQSLAEAPVEPHPSPESLSSPLPSIVHGAESSQAATAQREDEQARAQALDTQDSYIVQAPAGSGKTELLTQRLLALLGEVERPEQILAITFTRKAAGEMRDRVLLRLREAAEDPGTLESPVKALGSAPPSGASLAQRALANARARGWRLLETPVRLRIQTIDAFCREIVSANPLLAAWNPQRAPEEDCSPLYLAAAGDILRRAAEENPLGKALRLLLRHVDNEAHTLRKGLAELLSRREQWLATLLPQGKALTAGTRTELEAQMATWLREKRSACAAALQQALGQAGCSELVRLAQAAGRRIHASGEDTARSPATQRVAALRSLTGTALPGVEDANARLWAGLAELLLTKTTSWRKKVDKRLGFPPDLKQEKQCFREILETLAAADPQQELAEAWGALREPVQSRFGEDEWNFLVALARVLQGAVEALSMRFAQAGRTDFSAFHLAACRALSRGAQANLRHVLMDEFQDCSRGQFLLLEALLRPWRRGDGNTLFLVGDPMQSIYRFRQVELRYFFRAQEQGIGPVRLHALALRVNRRAQAPLVQHLNALFGAQASTAPTRLSQLHEPALPLCPRLETHDPALETLWTVAPAKKGREQSSKAEQNTGAEDLESTELLRQREAERVGQRIVELRAAHPEDSIALLCRARTHLPHILQALHRHGVPCQGVELEALDTCQPALDAYALLCAWWNPADRAAWLAVLRAPWCGLRLSELLQIATDSTLPASLTIPERLGEAKLLEALSEPSAARCRCVREAFQRAWAQQERQSMRRSIEGLWIALGGPAGLRPEEQCHMERFFQLLEEPQEGEEDLPQRILRRMNKASDGESSSSTGPAQDASAQASAGPVSANPVQVMTIHRAKGLEFDLVVLPALERQGRRESTDLLHLLESDSGTLVTHAAKRSSTLPYEGSAAEDSAAEDSAAEDSAAAADKNAEAKRKLLKTEHLRAEHAELQRLLYVGCTRARKRLVFSAVLQEARSAPQDSLLRWIWGPLGLEKWLSSRTSASEKAPEQVAGKTTGRPSPAQRQIKRIYVDWDALPARAPLHLPSGSGMQTAHEDEEPPDESVQSVQYSAGLRNTERCIGLEVHHWLERIAREGLARWPLERLKKQEPRLRMNLAAQGVSQTEQAQAAAQVLEALQRTLEDSLGRWVLQSHTESAQEYRLSGILEPRQLRDIVLDRSFVENGQRWIVDYKIVRQRTQESQEEFHERIRNHYKKQLENYAQLLRSHHERAAGAYADAPIHLGLYLPLQSIWLQWAADSAPD